MHTTRLCTLAAVLNRDHVFALHAAVPELRECGVGVGQQPLLVGGIDPGACDHARTVARDRSCVRRCRSGHRGPFDRPGPFRRAAIQATSRATRGPTALPDAQRVGPGPPKPRASLLPLRRSSQLSENRVDFHPWRLLRNATPRQDVRQCLGRFVSDQGFAALHLAHSSLT